MEKVQQLAMQAAAAIAAQVALNVEAQTYGITIAVTHSSEVDGLAYVVSNGTGSVCYLRCSETKMERLESIATAMIN